MPNPLERAAAKGAGATKAAAARVKGLYGVFNTLAKEHAEASVLLNRAEGASDAAKQRDLWRKLRAELLSHEQGELKEVYSTLAEHQMMQDVVSRHESQAQQLESAIASVDGAAYGTEAWKGAVKALHELVKAHVDEEETEFFPLATDVMDKKSAEAVDERFKQTKKSIMAKFGID